MPETVESRIHQIWHYRWHATVVVPSEPQVAQLAYRSPDAIMLCANIGQQMTVEPFMACFLVIHFWLQNILSESFEAWGLKSLITITKALGLHTHGQDEVVTRVLAMYMYVKNKR